MTTASLGETAWGPGPTESSRVAGYVCKRAVDEHVVVDGQRPEYLGADLAGELSASEHVAGMDMWCIHVLAGHHLVGTVQDMIRNVRVLHDYSSGIQSPLHEDQN